MTSNLPLIGGRPEIEDASSGAACQQYTREWLEGRGFVFTYCRGQQRFLVAWSVADRWRSRRQLRVCVTHGGEFAAAHGLELAGDAAHEGIDKSSPFGDDSDQPFDRARSAGSSRRKGRGGGSDVSA